MSSPVPEVTPAQITPALVAELEAQIADLKAQQNRKARVMPVLKRWFAGVRAAATTPEAVKVEKSVAAVAVARLVLFAPSLAIYVDLVAKALGLPHVAVK